MRYLLYLLLCCLSISCASFRGPDRVAAIELGGCYFYQRHEVWWRPLHREHLNPKYYKAVRFKRRHDIVTDEYYLEKGQIYYARLAFDEKLLRRFSTPVPCSTIDSLNALAKPLWDDPLPTDAYYK